MAEFYPDALWKPAGEVPLIEGSRVKGQVRCQCDKVLRMHHRCDVGGTGRHGDYGEARRRNLFTP